MRQTDRSTRASPFADHTGKAFGEGQGNQRPSQPQAHKTEGQDGVIQRQSLTQSKESQSTERYARS
jgi:hypothetical protein